MIQIQNPKQHGPAATSVLDIRFLDFVFVSRFEFRISDFI